jgi:Subtilase family
MRPRSVLACALAVWASVAASTAQADFPYAPGADPHRPDTFRLAPGVAPDDFSETGDWKLSGTPESPAANPLTATVNRQADELCGIRGLSIVDRLTVQPAGSCATGPVRTAWEATTGRPDVVIYLLDSGIEWNDRAAMTDLRDKIHLNQGELPAPRHDLKTALVPGLQCATFRRATGGDYNPHGNYDVNGDGVFNVRDYACDSRVAAVVDGGSPRHALRHGPPGFLTPEDLILAFTDGVDHDHNGFANDIAGWNFLDNNNDPFDDVQYGHGTGEAADSSAEANNGGNVGTCPNCTVVPLRVGESFVTDANRFAQAALYATDNGADVIQEALGTLNAPNFARQAIEYAYHHGVTVIASAADEASEHHNEPGALPDAIVVNSVTKYSSLTSSWPSYLQLNGCTNFGPRVIVAVPSSSCSSEATGKAAGVAGLIYSAALDALHAGRLKRSSDCRRVDGTRCVITPNEVRQLMASGDVGSPAPADTGTGQADDVDFARGPESSCAQARVPACTDPNRQTTFAPDQHGGVVGPLPHTTRYPARRGFDEFYGYGRLNAYKAVSAALAGTIPPEAEITAPDWFAQIEPAQPSFAVRGFVHARSRYTCEVDVAPGAQPNSASAPTGDFRRVASGWCDGESRDRGFGGVLANVDIARLKAGFPPLRFTGNANGGRPQDSNGRPNTLPYAFTIRVVVRTVRGHPLMSGEDRRQLFLHRDADMLPAFPIELHGDGDSSPLLADLDGDNRNELIVATSDGLIHAFRADGSELPGWPAHTEPLPLHLGEHAYGRGGVGTRHYAAVLGALAAGDLFGDGRLEVVADDSQGNVYAWDQQGRMVFHAHSNPAYSGAPLTPFHTVRQGVRDRTERGFLSSPVLASLDGKGLDIIAAGEDRHVYAWHANGKPVAGFPVLVADPDKVASVDPSTNHVVFKNVDSSPGLDEDQGKIVDTPAVAAIDGSGHPSIIVGTNEEYPVGTGDEGNVNINPNNSLFNSLIGASGQLKLANSRVYAIRYDGERSGHPFLPGWPVKVGLIDAGLLPDVGEGITGSPVVAPLRCPSGGPGAKIGVTPDAGPAYIFNANGSSCYGSAGGGDNTLATGFAPSTSRYDTPAYAAVGYPAFGTLDNRTIDFFAPVTGQFRAIDAAAPEYQGGQDFIGAWDPSVAAAPFVPGYPAEVNDLQFLTGPVVGDILRGSGQEVIGGTSSLDLQAFGQHGAIASSAWPKLTGDWTVATPTLGSFGTLDTSLGARKDIVSVTRSGTLSVYRSPASACSPSSWPRFHHDIANSGDYSRDAVPPGMPMKGRAVGRRGRRRLRFLAPGGDLLCGAARTYQLATSNRSITPQSFASARRLSVALRPGKAGSTQQLMLPSRTLAYVAIRAIDGAGNIGRPLVLKLPR